MAPHFLFPQKVLTMKVFLSLFMVFAIASTDALAFDLGKVKINVGDQCIEKAMTLATASGVAALKAYDQYNKNQSITAVELGIGTEAYINLKDYVGSGCAKSHLETALSQLQ